MQRWLVSLLLALLALGCRDECFTREGRFGAEAALMHDLHEMRKAIDDFYGDQHRFPHDLNELVPNYLRKIPPDPLTNMDDWIVIKDGQGIVDVKTAAKGQTCDGKPYGDL